MEANQTKFKKTDVLPIVKYYMDQLGIYGLFSEFVPQCQRRRENVPNRAA